MDIEGRVNDISAEISDLRAGLGPKAIELLRCKQPLVAIENERAAISRALGGKTGLFDQEPPGDAVIDLNQTPTKVKTMGRDDPDRDRIRELEAQSLQVMEALQLILQTIEDERAKREKLQDVVLKVAEEADGILRRAG